MNRMQNNSFVVIFFLAILVLKESSVAFAYIHQSDRVLALKRQLYSDLLDEIDRTVVSIENNENIQRQSSAETEISTDLDDENTVLDLDDDDDDSEYKKFFGEVLSNDVDDDVSDETSAKVLNTRQKRFLGSLLEKLTKKKNKTRPHNPNDDDFFHKFTDDDEDEPRHTTKKPTVYPISTTKPRPIVSTSKQPAPLPSAAQDDPFYRLKNHCALTFDSLCSSKKSEMHDLVKKCDRLQLEHKNQVLEPCRDVYSIYCYVFYERFTCLGQNYEPYVPGRKKFTSGTSTTTRGGQTIKINLVTTTSPKPKINVVTTTTTTKQTTKQTTTTTKPTTYTKGIVTTQKPTVKPSVTSGGGGGNPFGSGPVKIPNEAEKLKEIGAYCMKTKTKEPNCDQMLKLLKDKFKVCEKKPKTDTECQTFKVNFCTAYNNFPCCPDVLAGRTCSGKSNSSARQMLYM